MAGSPPSPITTEGVLASVAPDGRTLLLTLQDGSFQLSSLDGERPQPVRSLVAGDRLVSWSRDGTAVYVQRGVEAPALVERASLSTGERTIVREIEPEGLDAVVMVDVRGWVDDGRWFVYNYTALPSTLFVVTGASLET